MLDCHPARTNVTLHNGGWYRLGAGYSDVRAFMQTVKDERDAPGEAREFDVCNDSFAFVPRHSRVTVRAGSIVTAEAMS